ncbi:MAG: nucleotide exchange factor GrpE [Candidatus Cloacimonas sp.]|jgi:molecular chaperone GrpE (heat shock protein)|nr:nucleotide exchange factor GrpE [Candidatus Cloacimonas sp.]
MLLSETDTIVTEEDIPVAEEKHQLPDTTPDAAMSDAEVTPELDAEMPISEPQELAEAELPVAKPVNEAVVAHPIIIDEGIIQAISDSLAKMQTDFSRLCLRLDNKILMDDIRDKTIDQMGKELKELREDQLFRAIKPLVNGIIDVADDMSEAAKTLSESDDSLRVLLHFKVMIQDVLDTLDISAFNSQNLAFDASIHSIVKKEITTNQSLDKTISASLLTGYKRAGSVLRKEKVIVYRYEKPLEDETIPEVTTSVEIDNSEDKEN